MYLCRVLNKYVVPKVSFNRNFVCGVAGSFDHAFNDGLVT